MLLLSQQGIEELSVIFALLDKLDSDSLIIIAVARRFTVVTRNSGGLMNSNRPKETSRLSDESAHAAPSSAWLLLSLAISLEITGALGLRFSQGFTLPLPTGIALAAFTLALYLVSRVMKTLPVSVAYPVWAGGGTAGVALLGVLALSEPLNAAKALGVVCVVAGVILVNKTSEKTSGC